MNLSVGKPSDQINAEDLNSLHLGPLEGSGTDMINSAHFLECYWLQRVVQLLPLEHSCFACT